MHIGEQYKEAFQRNLVDWYRGGPHDNGWTRTGPAIEPTKEVEIYSIAKQDIDVEDVFAKNRDEVMKWHVEFLERRGGMESHYYREYIKPRAGTDGRGMGRAHKFMKLFEDIKRDGFNEEHPVWVADVSPLELGFQYFRFDGCHRAVIAHVLGHKTVPALVFKIREVT